MKIKNGFVLREICGENVISEEGLSNVNVERRIHPGVARGYAPEGV